MDDIDFASYADDNVAYAIESDMEESIVNLQNASKLFYMVDKRHFICSSSERDKEQYMRKAFRY